MPKISVLDTILHYEEAGSGEPLLLLHGGGGTALLHYRKEIEELGELYHVIAPDMRGYGRSSPPRLFTGDFYQQDAADMAALIEARELGPVHVCGWSDGAIAGLILAADYPQLVQTLCVWGAEGRILPEERGAWTRMMDTSGWTDQALERFVAAQGPLNWPGLFDHMLTGYVRVLEEGGQIVSDRLDRVSCPTLIMHGDDDDVVPAVHAYELNSLICGSELRVFHGAGHALHRERHHELMEAIVSFLRRQHDAEQPNEEGKAPAPVGAAKAVAARNRPAPAGDARRETKRAAR